MQNALWNLRLEQLHILDADEDGFASDGDEPYLVAVGFRSRFRTPGSTQVFWGEMLDDKWANGVEAISRLLTPIIRIGRWLAPRRRSAREHDARHMSSTRRSDATGG
ncbi:MAG TPA: hypothetical protein VEK80_17660 [Kribbellaceae bacterium]|nr:hypothetical protein [Kribbellaceae bacterium]